MEPLSFADICRIEPEIARLYRSVKELVSGRSAQYLWDRFYRMALEQLVGPSANAPQLRSPQAQKIVIDKFAELLGLRNS